MGVVPGTICAHLSFYSEELIHTCAESWTENLVDLDQRYVGCTSFFPAKPLGTYGDGGMCFTNDKDMFDKLLSIRVHGQGTDKYNNVRVGINGRLDTLMAAILLPKFEIFEEEIQLRQKDIRLTKRSYSC